MANNLKAIDVSVDTDLLMKIKNTSPPGLTKISPAPTDSEDLPTISGISPIASAYEYTETETETDKAGSSSVQT